MREQISKRSLNPVLALAGVAAGVALIVVVTWILNTPQSQPQSGQAILLTPVQTRGQLRAATQVVQLRPDSTPPTSKTPSLEVEQSQDQASTPAPKAANLTPKAATPTPSSPTPKPTARARVLFNSAFRLQEEIWDDVDLNCDGLDERVVTIDAYHGYPEKTHRFGIVGIAIKIPVQDGYRQAWEYRCELDPLSGMPDCTTFKLKLLATDNCEQFIVWGGYSANKQRLLIFRWDGKDVSLVLDTRALYYLSTQDPFGLITSDRECSNDKCDGRVRAFVWNGTEFVSE